MTAYYNENDPKAAAWLRELIFDGRIAWGDVDERSIEDVRPGDLDGYTQCHFFAGIGGWSYALRLAGWPDNRPVWTGSCPCQPFSQAGAQRGFDDPRHLWPAFGYLAEKQNPPVIFGEQVASPAGLAWLDVVLADLEGADYACAAADLCAASVGAPHIRQRLYWVAHHHYLGRKQHAQRDGQPVTRSEEGARGDNAGGCSLVGHAGGERLEVLRVEQARRERETVERSVEACELALAHGGDAGTEGLQRSRQHGQQPQDCWTPCEWIPCRDGKSRPVEPGAFPLAHGISGRVGLLRGYGNAIVAPQAAVFIQAARDVIDE